MDFVKSYKSRDSLYRLCKKLARHAGIPTFGPHALRHYFSTALYIKGVPVQFIRQNSRSCRYQGQQNEFTFIFGRLKDLLGVTDCLD